MKTKLLLLLFLLNGLIAMAQPTLYLDRQFAVSRRDTSIVYGNAIGYRGCSVSLLMDLYKPVNTLTNRPVVVLVHGGSLTAGNRHAPNMVAMADSLASRGYVVASVEYRLGYHQNPFIPQNWGCAIFQGITGVDLDECTYPADSLEMYRAHYRAIQDVKGAIRFLRSRSAVDSTSKDDYFVGGESAGGIVALGVGLMDLPAEKYASAGAVADAGTPSGPLCPTNPCPSTSLARPDLGDIHGTIALNGEREDVLGIVNLYGGLLDPTLMDQGLSKPRIYLYHQSCDPVVPFMRDKVYKGLNSCVGCSGCPQIGIVPWISGGGALDAYNTALPLPSRYEVWTDFESNGNPINCYYGFQGPDFNTCPQPLNTCPYCMNSLYGNCHNVTFTPTRMHNIADFLYDGIVNALNSPLEMQLTVSPNPFSNRLDLRANGTGLQPCEVKLVDVQGKVVANGRLEHGQSELVLATQSIAAGVYALVVCEEGGRQFTKKMVKE